LAAGSKQGLNVERLKRFGSHKILLYPDADGFTLWQKIAVDARKQGLTVEVSDLIETRATVEQKENGYDLADYLIEQQRQINQCNNFVDSYNAKLETVLADESLFTDFETILDERKAIAVYNSNESEFEAERQLHCPDYFREIVLSL